MSWTLTFLATCATPPTHFSACFSPRHNRVTTWIFSATDTGPAETRTRAMDNPDTPSEVVFRANKRRKVIRKRNIDDLDELAADHSEEELTNRISTVRLPAARKHGIGFSSAAAQPAIESTTVVETALVPFQKDEDEASVHDRFTKPTGKADVVEDKHLYDQP